MKIRHLKKRIHVNRHNIARNRRRGDKSEPVYTVKTSRGNNVGQRVALLNDAGEVVATFVYQPEKPLNCGAVAWLETNLSVAVDIGNGEMQVVD